MERRHKMTRKQNRETRAFSQRCASAVVHPKNATLRKVVMNDNNLTAEEIRAQFASRQAMPVIARSRLPL